MQQNSLPAKNAAYSTGQESHKHIYPGRMYCITQTNSSCNWRLPRSAIIVSNSQFADLFATVVREQEEQSSPEQEESSPEQEESSPEEEDEESSEVDEDKKSSHDDDSSYKEESSQDDDSSYRETDISSHKETDVSSHKETDTSFETEG